MKSELRKTVKLAGALLLAVIAGGAAIPATADHRDRDWDHDRWVHRDGPPGHYKHFKRYRRHYEPPAVYRDYWYEPYYVERYPAPRVYEYYAPRRYPGADLNFNLNVPLF